MISLSCSSKYFIKWSLVSTYPVPYYILIYWLILREYLELVLFVLVLRSCLNGSPGTRQFICLNPLGETTLPLLNTLVWRLEVTGTYIYIVVPWKYISFFIFFLFNSGVYIFRIIPPPDPGFFWKWKFRHLMAIFSFFFILLP